MLAKRDAAAASPDLMMLRGVRLALASETEDGQRLAEARVKLLTGGDLVTARPLYGGQVTFPQTAKLVIVGNHKPQITGTEDAIWRRVKLIPFEFTIPEAQRDLALPEKLTREMPGILAWMVAGCIKWHQSGLKLPPAVAAATNSYRSESDIFGEWFSECCVSNATATTHVRDLYPIYKQWAITFGHRPWSSTRWGKLMGASYVRVHTATGTAYAGVELSPAGYSYSRP